jgi:hypothetical protein
MAKELTPQEMFEIAGRSLNPGGDWQGALSSLLSIRRDSVRQLLSGRMELKPGHFRDLMTAIVHQREELGRVERQLREWLARQPQDPP